MSKSFTIRLTFHGQKTRTFEFSNPLTINELMEHAGCDRYYPWARIYLNHSDGQDYNVTAQNFDSHVLSTDCTIAMIIPLTGG